MNAYQIVCLLHVGFGFRIIGLNVQSFKNLIALDWMRIHLLCVYELVTKSNVWGYTIIIIFSCTEVA